MATSSAKMPVQAVLADPTTQEVRRAVRECAEDLASVRDRMVILRGIVRRTRALLGTDMAYLSLNDLPAGETYIHVTDGVETEAYQTIRMPLGTGVLGSVAAGGTSVQTSDYLHDAEMNHLTHIDDIVRGEGVCAILGVPIRVGGRVVAALMVAHRARTTFTPVAVAALLDMAAQAGVAFEQLRQSAEITRLRTELASAASSTARRHHELTALLQLDDRLMGALLASTGLVGIVDVLGEAIGAPVSVYDPSGALLAGTAVFDQETLRAADIRAAISVSQSTQAQVATQYGDNTLLMMAAAAGDEHLATLVTVDGPNRQLALHRASVFVSTLLLFERTLVEADNRAQSELMENLVSAGPRDKAALLPRLAAHGVDGTKPVELFLCSVATSVQQDAIAAVREALSGGPALISLHSGHICAVRAAEGGGGRSIGERIRAHLEARGVQVLIGIAAVERATEVSVAHDEAMAIVESLRALGRTSGATDAVGLGLAGLVAGIGDDARVSALISEFLGPLQDYDAKHGTELCLTAWEYLENGGHHGRIARGLHLHPNTVRQRAERIDAVLGAGWREAPTSVDFHFALRLWRLTRQGSDRPTPA